MLQAMPRHHLILLAICLVLTALLSAPPVPPIETSEGELVLPRPEVLKTLGAPFIHAIADLYWLRTGYAVGMAKDRLGYLRAYRLGDLVTRLDPDFEAAYLFVGQSIPFNEGGLERWKNTDESTELLERGHARFPGNLQMRLQLAFNYSYHHRRYRAAADLLDSTRHLPGAPPYLPQLITRLYAQSGHTDRALELAELLFEMAEEEAARAIYARRIQEIRLEALLQAVEAARDRFHAREGHPPESIDELRLAQDLDALPSDPLGGDIYLSKEDGRAHSTSQTRRLEIYRAKPSPLPGYEEQLHASP
ncbi:MAG: hypothetical protein LBM75_02570 [Myxococcales bacterium]|jgi:hypothetical protein|nr:hypothetical protein [Myxococcales bacterium]